MMGEVGDEGGGARDRREGDGAQGDDSLGRADGHGDNFGFFRAQHMKTGRMRAEAFYIPVICGNKVGLGIARRYRIGRLG